MDQTDDSQNQPTTGLPSDQSQTDVPADQTTPVDISTTPPIGQTPAQPAEESSAVKTPGEDEVGKTPITNEPVETSTSSQLEETPTADNQPGAEVSKPGDDTQKTV